MGENFRVNTAKAYGHFMQNQLAKLEPGLLFAPEEITALRYPVRLYDDAPTVAVGDKATIVLRRKSGTPAFLMGVNVVGRVEGEAAKLLRSHFERHDVWPGVMDVTVVAVYPSRKMCDVSPH
jgi:hypothetical protein